MLRTYNERLEISLLRSIQHVLAKMRNYPALIQSGLRLIFTHAIPQFINLTGNVVYFLSNVPNVNETYDRD